MREKVYFLRLQKIELQNCFKRNLKKDLEKYFTGPTAAAISSDQFQQLNFNKFSKTNKKLKIIAGFMDGKVLDEKECL